MPNWDEIRKEYESSKITLAALAEKHGIKLGTLKSRKSREEWSRGSPKKDATKIEKVATLKNKDASQKQTIREVQEVVVESDELTDKQWLFCIYYVKYFNATKAYQKAYEADYMTANANGSRLLVNASIKSEIQRLKQQRMDEAYFDKYDVLQKYKDIAFADITDYVEFGQERRPELDHNLEPMIDENGDEITYSYSYVNLKNHDEVDGTLITEIKKGKDGVSVKLADKMKALDFLAKYTDLLNENELKQLKVEREKIAIRKESGDDGDEYEDDGFLDALKGVEVNWDE